MSQVPVEFVIELVIECVRQVCRVGCSVDGFSSSRMDWHGEAWRGMA
jgi:hypothetical protein